MAVVTEIVAPYRIPVFNELSRLLGGALDVFFIAETESRRRSWPILREEIEFACEILGGTQLSLPYRGDRLPIYLSRPLLPRLLRRRYDVAVVGGWNHLECYQALAYCRARRKPFVFWSEVPLFGALPRRPIRNALKRQVIRQTSSFVAPGPAGAAYLTALGAPSSRLHQAPNAVDNEFWSRAAGAAPTGDALTLLFVGRLIQMKGLGIALEAFARSQLVGRARFVVVGDGPERARLELAAPPGVTFLGEQSREELREQYRASDLLVLPTMFDAWGLVVNEAACAGVPTLGTDRAGAVLDLVIDGVNGLVVPAGDVGAMAAAFDRIAADPSLLRRLSVEARGIADRASPRACAEGIYAAVRQAVAG